MGHICQAVEVSLKDIPAHLIVERIAEFCWDLKENVQELECDFSEKYISKSLYRMLLECCYVHKHYGVKLSTRVRSSML